jgi:5-methylcytosine-specific restriction endonuclease McrA
MINTQERKVIVHVPRDPRRRFTSSQRRALWIYHDGRCAVCDGELSEGWHADHIVPHSLGGRTEIANGQALCRTCNLRKGSRVDSK